MKKYIYFKYKKSKYANEEDYFFMSVFNRKLSEEEIFNEILNERDTFLGEIDTEKIVDSFVELFKNSEHKNLAPSFLDYLQEEELLDISYDQIGDILEILNK